MWYRRSFLLLASAALAAAQTATPATPQRLEEQIRGYTSQDRFNGAILVAKDGKIVLSKGYGMANFEWSEPVTPDTKFRLGSITKQFTAMAVLLLSDQGKLKLDDPVCNYVAPCPDAWKPITIHHLLTHTSGIPNFTNFPEYAKTMTLASPPAESLKKFLDKPLDFAPGSSFNYSNSGYVLLGYIIEKVTGGSYADYLRKNILSPLGMNDTGYDDTVTVLPRRAAGYERTGTTLQNAKFLDMSIPHAAGSLYSTTLDLMKWDEALTAHKILSTEAYKRYFTPIRKNYAYGWTVKTEDGVEQINHSGGINGFNTRIVRVPSQHLVVVALNNVIPGQPDKLAQELVKLMLGLDLPVPEKPAELKLSNEALEKFVGNYSIAPTFILAVTLEGDQLMTQATGQGKIPIFAKSANTFYPKVIEAEIVFDLDAEGKATGLTLIQNGRRMPAKRQ
ncbi:serine hydrolase [Paludibaculum fermentans]|uniref:Serine hydrolase n=1 Tax=Paludibaculum fermentans TaxID=1473598 RepID=A0A7S7NTV8_PALFE|nr:serine hydrolase [Paludibaculum fermentans]QOY89732.1 serine hydrolase [Paludibaculum fermentans]